MGKSERLRIEAHLMAIDRHRRLLRSRLDKIDKRTKEGKVRAKVIYSRIASLMRRWERFIGIRMDLLAKED